MRLDKLGLSQVQEDDRLLCVDDAHGLIVLIEDQNLGIQPPGGTPCVDLRAEVSLTSLLSGKMNGSPLQHCEENIPHVGYIVKPRPHRSLAWPRSRRLRRRFQAVPNPTALSARPKAGLNTTLPRT
jgi:hypothetical protein